MYSTNMCKKQNILFIVEKVFLPFMFFIELSQRYLYYKGHFLSADELLSQFSSYLTLNYLEL